MAKKFTFDDLENKEIMDEKHEDEKDLYDLIIPPGTPSSLIYDMVEMFDLEPINRKVNVNIVNEAEREVLALRGDLETVQEAEKFMYEELDSWVSSKDY
ncbi:conserved hypothetical protein [Methanohalobium evestigatum Z-7303]|uniref:Uncharacterized protein n=1 Tax=Methanohalobium evestigatum (strain ATCC BAA-1072 / DSM 3721 / NBRC 107634 / OCM 161 / Z-7303) TaxID=644295 RepID=D7E945_METEZ|nr:hypothetical protein [Methanohalobium evestigatum]ADI73993.1 conserved hypothetical protein [Methanohalobium evestigatum Z-7303]